MNTEDINIKIMEELVKKKSLRDAVKWLDTSVGKDGESPADLIRNGNSKKALSLLKKINK